MRSFAIWAAIAAFFGVNALTWWPIALAFVVLSVQVGRGWMLRRAGVRWTMRVASVIALLAAPILLAIGGLLGAAGAYAGPETKDVDFAATR